MKPKILLTGLIALLIFGGLIATGSTDGYYVAAAIGSFLLCALYAEGCARL
jgi:hypothetical protein